MEQSSINFHPNLCSGSKRLLYFFSREFLPRGGKFWITERQEDTNSWRKCPALRFLPVGRELPFLDSRHDRGTIYDASVPPCFEKGGTLLLRAATTGDSPFSEVRWTEYISRPRDLSRTNKFLARNADNVFPLLERRGEEMKRWSMSRANFNRIFIRNIRSNLSLLCRFSFLPLSRIGRESPILRVHAFL